MSNDMFSSSSSSVLASSSSSVPYSEDLEEFNKNFVKVDWNMLMGITIVANFLDIKGLSILTYQTGADYIKDRTSKEVRILFNIENDFTRWKKKRRSVERILRLLSKLIII